MTDESNIYWHLLSDNAIFENIGYFIKNEKIEQNKTQNQLVFEAGINRSTLIEFEKGNRSNLLTLIQILRSLNQLNLLSSFQIENQIIPIMLAELVASKRKRASKTKKSIKKTLINFK